eukprot:8729448-Pyramimonas_sp.AAC.1
MAFEQEVLLSGKHPCEGFYGGALKRAHTGKPLGVRACLLGWRGDFEARKECHCMPWYYRTKSMCDLCEAQ